MKKIIDVQIGEVKGGRGDIVLQSKAVGSCIAIVAYDANKVVGTVAHIMLPGKAPLNKEPSEKTKYAADAIDAMIVEMNQLGSNLSDFEISVIGAGNVLQRKDDTLCKDNIKSVLALLKEKQLEIKALAIGGTARRSVSLDVANGIISYTEGNSREMQLWT